MIRILIADDQAIVRRGLKQILSETDDIVVVAEAKNSAEAVQKYNKHQPDVVLLDISMPGRGGIDVLKEIRAANRKTPALMLSIFPEDQYAVRALKSGAAGYLTKNCSAETLIEAIRKVACGGTYVSPSLGERLANNLQRNDQARPHETLSNREYEVFMQIASGKSTRDIAGTLNLSVQTVSTYRSRIRQKMQLYSMAEFTAYAIKNALLEL